MKRINIGNFDLPDMDADYFKVAVKLHESRSQRGLVSESVKGYLHRFRNVLRDRVDYKARELDITWEQAFNLYLNFDEPFTDEMIEAAKTMKPTILKEYGQTNLGNEMKEQCQ